MAAKSSTFGFDPSSLLDNAVSQFRGLNPNEPGQWPWLPRLAAWTVAVVAVVAVGWFAVLTAETDELQAERDREPGLKQEYRRKLEQAVNLAELRKQKEQVAEYVKQLQKQLPGKSEIDALLSDINNAGVSRGLLFELFRPGNVVVKDFYAELPITIKVSGRYHEIGAFAEDVAKLSRIVTLHNLAIAPLSARDADGALAMDATARTYRYLDPDEVEAQKKAAAAAKASAKGGPRK
ncbi:MAG TPA: type 4a pilus biogenesis protein PilO [Rubrivivax sp.]|jgi:type IV pilus assembly protein PilO|nr:type 4a pilus biogenesis protein PilO [Rubrivivax sp.]